MRTDIAEPYSDIISVLSQLDAVVDFQTTLQVIYEDVKQRRTEYRALWHTGIHIDIVGDYFVNSYAQRSAREKTFYDAK